MYEKGGSTKEIFIDFITNLSKFFVLVYSHSPQASLAGKSIRLRRVAINLMIIQNFIF
jgi:hypothetical protein